MTKRYSPSGLTNHVRTLRPRRRIGVEDVSAYLAEAIERGEIETRRYLPSVAPKPSPSPRSRDDELVEPTRIEVEGVRWAVARVAHGCERQVARDLADAGFRTYCPLGRKFVKHARIKGESWRRARKVKQSPVFARYVFVGSSGGVGIGKHSHDKIESIVSDSSGALAIPARVIALVNDLELAGQWDQTRSWRESSRFAPACRCASKPVFSPAQTGSSKRCRGRCGSS